MSRGRARAGDRAHAPESTTTTRPGVSGRALAIVLVDSRSPWMGDAPVAPAAASVPEAHRFMARQERETATRKGRRPRRRSSGGSVRRVLGMLALIPLANRAPTYARLLWALARDERTPVARKAVLGGALGYIVLGRDIVPDDVPILGGLDDVVVLALALDLFIDGVDDAVLNEHLVALDIDRTAFDEDIARLRRILPGPIRRTVRRLPGLIGSAGEALQHSGLGPRLRAWITKEGSLA